MIEHVFASGEYGIDLMPALVCDTCRKQVAGDGNLVWFVRPTNADDFFRDQQASPLFVCHKGLCDEMLMAVVRRHYPLAEGWTDQSAEARLLPGAVGGVVRQAVPGWRRLLGSPAGDAPYWAGACVVTAGIPRQRRPYLDACPMCPDSPRVPPVVVTADGGAVVADYLCPDAHVWSTGWARDPDHDRWAA